MHQNVSKPNKRAPRIVYGPIVLPFYVIIVSFFFFSVKMQTKQNQFVKKKLKLALYKTKSREPNYVDHISLTPVGS